MRQPSRIEGRDEVVAPRRQLITNHIGKFQVDEMLRRLLVAQLRLARRTPTVRLRPEIFDLIDSRRTAEKRRKIGGQVFGGEAIDHPMSIAAPSEASG